MEEEEYTEHSVQSSADIVRAISNADKHRINRDDNVECYPIDFDVDGPLGECAQMIPLKAEISREKAVTMTQLKAFRHYIWKREEQDTDIMTDKDGLVLPSVSAESVNKVTQVRISRSHL